MKTLEERADNYKEELENRLSIYINELSPTDIMIAYEDGAKDQLKIDIQVGSNWLNDNVDNYKDEYTNSFDTERCVSDFIKIMKGK